MVKGPLIHLSQPCLLIKAGHLQKAIRILKRGLVNTSTSLTDTFMITYLQRIVAVIPGGAVLSGAKSISTCLSGLRGESDQGNAQGMYHLQRWGTGSHL